MNPVLAVLDLQTGVLMALAALTLAAAVVSWGAWVLLRRERHERAGRPADPPMEEPAAKAARPRAARRRG